MTMTVNDLYGITHSLLEMGIQAELGEVVIGHEDEFSDWNGAFCLIRFWLYCPSDEIQGEYGGDPMYPLAMKGDRTVIHDYASSKGASYETAYCTIPEPEKKFGSHHEIATKMKKLALAYHAGLLIEKGDGDKFIGGN